MTEQVIDILKSNVDELADEEIEPQTKLIEGGYIDSFDIINLISVFERELDMQIPLAGLDLSDFETAEKIGGFLQGMRA